MIYRVCSISLIFLLALILVTTHEVEAQTQGFGLGIIVGEPTGISGKLWTGQTVAFAAGAAWSFEGESLHLHLDYLLHNFDVIPVGVGQLPVYFGIGGRVNLQDDDTKIGVRIPVGLNYHFEEAPVDLFLELVPIMDMIPDTDFFLNGGLGLRFFFGKNRKSN